jgi:FdhE protein
MGKNGWQERIFRAKTLARDYPFASEILNFYCTIAEFQERLYTRIESAAGGRKATGASGVSPVEISNIAAPPSGTVKQVPLPIVAGPPELSALLASFPEFLALVEKYGPTNLAEAARQLRSAPNEIHTELLNDFWDGPRRSDAAVPAASATNNFFAHAFLQPYAEFARVRAESSSNGYTGSLCPFCGRKPGVAVLRPLGDGGQRRLVCSFCLAEWEFRRLVCAHCGQEDHKKLPVYTADQFPHVRVDCCDTCRHYVKTIDLTKIGLADPLVDELASIPLDLWARDHGYEKLELNFVQL